MPLNEVKTLQECNRALVSLGNKIRSSDSIQGRIHKITEAGLEALKAETGKQIKALPAKPAPEPADAVKPASKQTEETQSPMSNKLIDLNNHLFAQLERLSDGKLTGDQLNEEIDRAKSVTLISREIVANARLALDAQIALGDGLIKKVPELMALDSNA